MDMMDREDRIRSARIAVVMALLLSLALVWAAIFTARPAAAEGCQAKACEGLASHIGHTARPGVKSRAGRLAAGRTAAATSERMDVTAGETAPQSQYAAGRMPARMRATTSPRAGRAAVPRARPHASLSCLPASIRAALDRAGHCGVRVISTYRRGAIIAGTRTRSKHASCEAADFTARDQACVLAALRAFPGKLSTDYWRVRPPHFHIDNGRFARFVHRSSRASRTALDDAREGNIFRRYAEGRR